MLLFFGKTGGKFRMKNALKNPHEKRTENARENARNDPHPKIRIKKIRGPSLCMRTRGSVLFYGGCESLKDANALTIRKFPKAMKV